MKCVDFKNSIKEPLAISLGFFDCIHKGHESLVRSAIRYAHERALNSALLTFSNDPNVFFNKDKQIYTVEDRQKVLVNLGVDFLVTAQFDNDFSALSPQQFFDALTSRFNIKAIFIGEDYTFGARAMGNADTLKAYCEQCGVKLVIVPFENVAGEKLATRNLKSLVKNGEVSTLNDYLSEPYFMDGIVLHERHAGTSIGFPTANIKQNADRLPLANGIYATICNVDCKKYIAMTNVGSKPTFGDNSASVETYIIDFNGDVYGKQIQVQFIQKMREIVHFSSKDELVEQLQQDEARAREILQDCKYLK